MNQNSIKDFSLQGVVKDIVKEYLIPTKSISRIIYYHNSIGWCESIDENILITSKQSKLFEMDEMVDQIDLHTGRISKAFIKKWKEDGQWQLDDSESIIFISEDVICMENVC